MVKVPEHQQSIVRHKGHAAPSGTNQQTPRQSGRAQRVSSHVFGWLAITNKQLKIYLTERPVRVYCTNELLYYLYLKKKQRSVGLRSLGNVSSAATFMCRKS